VLVGRGGSGGVEGLVDGREGELGVVEDEAEL